ncbi:hypothetical protein D3C71_856970 [compost metagenome]
MTKDQAQVQRGNGEGLAGPGAGFDQLTSAQRECKGKRCLGGHERASSLDIERQGASSNGR